MTFTLFLASCIETFEFETREVDTILIVEATLTDELSNQTVLLGRAADLENVNIPPYRNNVTTSSTPESSEVDTRIPEKNATVTVLDDMGNTYPFSESEEGIYESETPFATEIGRNYQLLITTADGRSYTSESREAVGSSNLENIYAERIVNDAGEEGMAIYADGVDETNSRSYFRYTYEETYKIIAPNWTEQEFEITREALEFDQFDNPLYPDVRLVPRAQEEQVCYKTVNSTAIKLASADLLDQSVSERKLIRFISRNNPILSHRYSVLVKQFVISDDTHSYYQVLDSFSSSESVFSEIQPGFLEGNIRGDTEEDIVIGYFDVSSVSQKRLYFDYVDFFEGEELPPYFFNVNCSRRLSFPIPNPERDGPPSPDGACPEPLISRIKRETVEFTFLNGGPGICEGPYFVTPRICGDCTALGTNVKPDFWID
ncbi:MAG: hypothetical protein Mars2KO_26010 [Maribacter sp.]